MANRISICVTGKARQNEFFFRNAYISPLFKTLMIQPLELWDSQQQMFLAQGVVSFTGVVYFSIKDEYVRSHNIMGWSFLLACGISAGKDQGKQRPWVSIGDSLSHNGLTKAWAAGGNSLNGVSEIGSRCENRSITLIDLSRKEQIVISVEMEEVVDGVPIYCIDLKSEDITVGGK